MTPEDREIAIQFEKVDKHMRDTMKIITASMFVLLVIMISFFWFITK